MARCSGVSLTLRLESASPSGSRHIGQSTISTGSFSISTMRRMTAICWKSFRRNRLCRGGHDHEAAHHLSHAVEMTGTHGSLHHLCDGAEVEHPCVGLRIHLFDCGDEGHVDAPAASSRRQSASSVRGYVRRSSGLLNCVGLTNTLTTVNPFSSSNGRRATCVPHGERPHCGHQSYGSVLLRASATALCSPRTVRMISIWISAFNIDDAKLRNSRHTTKIGLCPRCRNK